MTNEEIWLERVVAWRASGMSAAEFCSGAAFDVRSLQAWSSRLGREGKVSRSPLGRRSKGGSTPSASTVQFAQVRARSAEKAGRAQEARGSGGSRAPMAIRVGASRIEVSEGFDASLLRAVVAALEEGAE